MKDTLKADYKTKGVTFNLADPEQSKDFAHAMKHTNFSGYIKRLIQRDREAQEAQQKPAAVRSATGGIKIDLR